MIFTSSSTSRARVASLLLAVAGLGGLGACSDASAPTAANVTAATGSIAVELTGLPLGSTTSITLRRGSASRVVSSSTTVDGLEAGEWSIEANAIIVDGLTYAPQPLSQTVNVPARSTGSARVLWTPTTGSLALSITGLPLASAASVEVNGPGGSRIVTESTVLTNLAPGEYVLQARDVRTGAGTMRSVLPSQNVSVRASAIPISATVVYLPAPAAVDVAVSGLPNGVQPAVSLINPVGAIIPITESVRLSPVVAGRWQLATATVTNGGYTYTPMPGSRDTTVSAGDTLRLQVSYVLSSGALAVAVTGLPQGVSGSVTVTGPAGYSQAVSSTTTLTGLTPGVYTVRADSVVRNNIAWRGAPVTQQVTVAASLTAAPATVAYTAVSGTLVVTFSNVPAGATGSVRITGPYGFDHSYNGNTVLSSIAAGSYSVSAAPITQGGVPYEVIPATVVRTVTLNGRDSVDMRYENVAGSLQVTVAGLPNGVNADITVTGNGQNIAVTASTTLSNLAAGSYTVSASTVSASGTQYTASPTSQNVTVARQAQATTTVTYSAGATAIDLVLDQAYLTQAAQKMDGSVTLVAGRDALLRVFAHADRSNVHTTTVRARIYDGAALLQTLTVSGPVGGVPQSVVESTLSASWNVLIPGANIRTGTRILVDIDPTNTVAEADETNNIWPRSGSAQAITVATVPAFNVRFVPVTVGALTGNITTGNMNAFLATTRLIFPLETINASVRAPFTSGADSLMSNDGNNNWLTVLSEMNTLRSTDAAASTLHYYGVVKVSYNSGVAGYGYVPGRTAVGWDYLPSGDGVAAHEWGHNFNRPHAPCGGASGADPSYPYAGGIIGTSGWNSSTNALVATSVFDIMGYCSPKWISDYNWTKVLTYRQAAGAVGTAGANGEGVLVWGRVSGSTVKLEPSFRVRAPATLPNARPTHYVDALDADGTVFMSLPIVADQVDHVTDQRERHFAVVLPWNAAVAGALSQVRVRDVRTPLVAASRASRTAVAAGLSRGDAATPLAMPDPAATVEPVAGGKARIRWNTTQYPMAMVRDATTGEIMGYVRRSGAEVTTGGRTLDVVFSDGVRTVTRNR